MARKSGHYTLLKSVIKPNLTPWGLVLSFLFQLKTTSILFSNQQQMFCWLQIFFTDFKSAYPLKNQSSSGMGRRAGGSGREALVEPPPPVYLGITLGV